MGVGGFVIALLLTASLIAPRTTSEAAAQDLAFQTSGACKDDEC